MIDIIPQAAYVTKRRCCAMLFKVFAKDDTEKTYVLNNYANKICAPLLRNERAGQMRVGLSWIHLGSLKNAVPYKRWLEEKENSMYKYNFIGYMHLVMWSKPRRFQFQTAAWCFKLMVQPLQNTCHAHITVTVSSLPESSSNNVSVETLQCILYIVMYKNVIIIKCIGQN